MLEKYDFTQGSSEQVSVAHDIALVHLESLRSSHVRLRNENERMCPQDIHLEDLDEEDQRAVLDSERGHFGEKWRISHVELRLFQQTKTDVARIST